jgi:hypothetical protein
MKLFPKCLLVNAVMALFAGSWFCGCVTRAQANAQARMAYQAGQKAAFASLAGEGRVVVIEGPVEHPNVPWIEGLTLVQAIATAQFTSHRHPKVITIVRQGETIDVNPRNLLDGHVVRLQPGDTVKLR